MGLEFNARLMEKVDKVWENENKLFETISRICPEQNVSGTMCYTLADGIIVRINRESDRSVIQVWRGDDEKQSEGRGAVIFKRNVSGEEIIGYVYEAENVVGRKARFATVKKGGEIQIDENSYLHNQIFEGAVYQEGQKPPKREGVELMEGESCIDLLREYMESNKHETQYPIKNDMMSRIIYTFEDVFNSVERSREKGENQESKGGESYLKKQIAGAGVECNITETDIGEAENIVGGSRNLEDISKE